MGRAEVLSCIFFLLSVLAYCEGVARGRGTSLEPLPAPKWHCILASILFCLCAMLSKEQGVVSLGVCAAFDVILHWDVFWEQALFLIKTKPTNSHPPHHHHHEQENGAVEKPVLKDEWSAGGVVQEEQNSSTLVVTGTTSITTKKQRKYSAKNHLVVSSLAKRLGIEL